MRRMLCVLLLAALPCGAETYLVAAGVERYDDVRIEPLEYAVADVVAVADAFRTAGVPDANLQVLTTAHPDHHRRPTRANIFRALDDVRDAAEAGDTVIFMFSGHGMQQGEQTYLLPVETRRKALRAGGMSLDALRDGLRGLRASNLLFIIDACRDDPEARRGRGGRGLPASGPLDAAERLTDAEELPQPAMLRACDVGERAWEMPSAGHGAMTAYLLEGLTGAARDDDGAVRLKRLASYVETKVPAWAARVRESQNPRLENAGQHDFVILGPPAPAAPLGPLVR